MDRLIDLIDDKDNPSVVGLDPTLKVVPAQLVQDAKASDFEYWPQALAMQFLRFNMAIIDAVADIVPAVKPQIAMYEALGPYGIHAYVATNEYARSKGLYVLGDVKRGDIGSTSEAYAAHLRGVIPGPGTEDIAPLDPWQEDAFTVNPYMGSDGIIPFTNAAVEADKDLFVLVKTSNPSSSEVQDLVSADDGLTIADHVADLVEQWGESTRGEHGYSRVGAVVGATHPKAGAELRKRMPHTLFLVPGYGAQGGSASDVAAMFADDGRGVLVNSSRGIIGAWRKSGRYGDDMTSDQALALVASSAREAAERMRDDLHTALRER